MSEANINLLEFISNDPIDKVVATGSITIENDGDTVGTTYEFQSSKIVTDSVENPYSKKCFVNFVWSIDETNFNSSEAHLAYTYTVTAFGATVGGLRGAVSVGANASTVEFRTANGYHGNVAGAGPFTYTPIAQTFTIKYALYEIE